MKKITGLDVADKLGLKKKYLEKKQANIDEPNTVSENEENNQQNNLKSIEQDFLDSDFVELPM